MKKPLYVFLHLPKCGGTTLKHHLVNSFNKKECKHVITTWKYDVVEKELIHEKFRVMPQEEKDKIKWLYGMSVWYDLKDCFPKREVRFVTVMREPFARMVSHYKFNVSRFGTEKPFLDWDMTLREEMGGENGRVIKMGGWFSKVGEYPNYIHRYLERLGFTTVEQFYFVGLTEKSKEDFFYLYYLMGSKRFFADMNITSKKVQVEVTEGYEEEFRKKNEKDLLWYDQCCNAREQYYKDNPRIYRLIERVKKRSEYRVFIRRVLLLAEIRLFIIKFFPRLHSVLRRIKWRFFM